MIPDLFLTEALAWKLAKYLMAVKNSSDGDNCRIISIASHVMKESTELLILKFFSVQT